MHIEYPVSNKI